MRNFDLRTCALAGILNFECCIATSIFFQAPTGRGEAFAYDADMNEHASLVNSTCHDEAHLSVCLSGEGGVAPSAS